MSILPERGPRYVESVSFSPEGQMLASGAEENIYLWDVNTGECLRILMGHTGNVESVSFSPDGQILASAGGYGDFTVRLWDVNRGKHLHTLTADMGYVESVSFSPDGRVLASGALGDGEVHLWDVSTRCTPPHPYGAACGMSILAAGVQRLSRVSVLVLMVGCLPAGLQREPFVYGMRPQVHTSALLQGIRRMLKASVLALMVRCSQVEAKTVPVLLWTLAPLPR